MDDVIAMWARIADAYDQYAVPLTTSILGPPLYARKTITERIEPYASEYDELAWELPESVEGYEPDPEYYQPTPKLKRLWRRLDALRAKGFREVPNPDYDEARAAEWEESRRKPYNQTKIVVGQRYSENLD